MGFLTPGLLSRARRAPVQSPSVLYADEPEIKWEVKTETIDRLTFPVTVWMEYFGGEQIPEEMDVTEAGRKILDAMNKPYPKGRFTPTLE
uniref:Uncharacterized protein n=1 Tax=Chromera velia CCMP2878 TaxID=1169474 RepID=A0A0G4HI63_9ALVE|eukprot:Cvel_27728.t1-p1 / transcript=Cvel_27728.t1 / gene=Cvel_27728 / organism=Chromera_velia_CCMP2878 / gene_product=hypothetical protein / transcript_product=hypothetical protein / location=Cvel_scaffold3509:3857-4705(-) / protein_length=89 / sequence_SO=supercontig / SO=protein_coding / is_pseudo=false